MSARADRRPRPRTQVRVFALVAALATMLVVPTAGQQAVPLPFDDWRAGLMAGARARGFSDALVNEALAGVEPREQVISEDRNQAEVVQTLGQYYRIRVSPTMVARGRALAVEHAQLLARIEAEYGVPRRFILAIWGMESQFGRITGGVPVFQALATLAWDPRRAEFFRGEIFAALSIVANGDITVAGMTGSWAGAMGQSQFLPSSYLQLAVDADGDGDATSGRPPPTRSGRSPTTCVATDGSASSRGDARCGDPTIWPVRSRAVPAAGAPASAA